MRCLGRDVVNGDGLEFGEKGGLRALLCLRWLFEAATQSSCTVMQIHLE